MPILEGAQKFFGKDKLTVFAVNYRDSPEASGYGDRSAEELATDITNALREPPSPDPAPTEGGS